MKKVLKIVVILIVVAFLAIDFYGLWKYKINGKRYVIETGDGDSGIDDSAEQIDDSYEDLTSETLAEGRALFIKNIESKDSEYIVKAVVFEPHEVSKDDYNALRAGDSVEILGATYKKNKIKNNNLILKSTDSSATEYYINYDTSNKKYILKEKASDNVVYKSTEKKVKFNVQAGTVFAIVKDGKTSKKKIEDVVDSHKELSEPEKETGKITTCTLTFTGDKCTKITETVR